MAKIENLLDKKDNVELIRNQIAGILRTEIDRQHELAEAAGIEEANQFLVSVLVDDDDPLAFGDDIFPCVNLALERTTNGSGSMKVNHKVFDATFFIDCYACGNNGNDESAASLATRRAWRLAGLVRSILTAEAYLYLDLRGIVGGTIVREMTTGVPKQEDSAIKATVVRIVFGVNYKQDVPATTGSGLELLNTAINYNGFVF